MAFHSFGGSGGGEGSGTVTSVSVTTANGVSGVVASPTTTPAITVTLGAITPSSVVASGSIRSATSLIVEETGAGTDIIAIQAPASIAASYTLTLPVDDGTSGQLLSTDGSGVLSWTSSSGGDVIGPASATDNAVARFDSTTGKLIQNGVLIVSDAGAVTGVTTLTASGALRSNTSLIVEETGAGTDIITIQAPSSIASSYTLTLPVDDGTSGQVLSTDGSGVLAWVTAAGDVSAGSNLTDNAIIRGDGGAKGVQTSAVLIDDGDNVTGMASLTLTNTGLHLLDTNATHDLIIAPGSNLTADRTLTVTTGDSNRTLTMTGDASIIGTNTGDSVFNSGTTTRVGDTASGTQTIAHGLGVSPKIVKITALKHSGLSGVIISNSFGGKSVIGTSDCIFSVINTAGSTSTGNASGTYSVRIDDGDGALQTAVITVDATNITLTWTKTNSPTSDTIYIFWEAAS